MNFEYDDRRAIAAGRYLRAAQFPVVDPAFTMAAYDPLITVCFEKMPFLTGSERAALREMIQRALEHMMSLPASSTHHHRTAGGLFFHSLETAALVPEVVIAGHSAFNPVESILLAGFVAGLLHDVGKVLSGFHVYPQTADIQDVGFGYLEEPELAAQRWNPHAESLWAWSQREGVTHLAIPYQRSAEIGHEAAATNGFWRRFVPEEVFDALVVRDQYVVGRLEEFLERKKPRGDFAKLIYAADRISVERDYNPLYRTSPKRSDLHLVRRFLEFSALSSWNAAHSPFVMADIWVDDRDLHIRVPLFRARRDFMQTFREYLFEEDMYGMAYRHQAGDPIVYEILEKHGVLKRTMPNCGGVFPHPAHPQRLPAFEAAAQYPDEAEENREREAFSYFPMGSRMSWLNMPPVRVFL